MAKLTVHDSFSSNRSVLSQEFELKLAPPNTSFLVHFQEFSPNLHTFVAKDYTHELDCETTLEVKEIFVAPEEEGEEGGRLTSIVSCNFPAISLEKLDKTTGFDWYIQELLIGNFQLKILECLLLFCNQNNADSLILTVSDTVHGADLDYLKIYRRFLVSEEQVNTSKGREGQLMIPVNMGTYDKVLDLMDKIDREVRCSLWRGQSVNPAFRKYLLRHAAA